MPPRKRPGLGKGLDALIPKIEEPTYQFSTDVADGTHHVVIETPIKNINPNPRQPRLNFDTDELSELAASIQEHGIIQPLIITHDEDPDQYILIAGERRLMAAKQAGLR